MSVSVIRACKFFRLLQTQAQTTDTEQRKEKLINKEAEINELDRLFDKLFPICRSITGPGFRESLDILNEYILLERFSVKTGTKVLNWEIPKEWRINEAWLKGPTGEKIVDFAEHNLHVVNYSIPVDKKLSLEELKKHLHTAPKLSLITGPNFKEEVEPVWK
ncbi:DUF2172 domain-containing protein [Natroniella sp. ANB-PHB2]|uniref:DUF2172 domain-containing protein n=1 Tax=Natroniella sp. ANB-PHB2 TaxID=3384444 RepID=UPI0038D4C154